MTLDQKLDYIGGTGFAVRAMPSLGLPALQMSEWTARVRSNQKFPPPYTRVALVWLLLGSAIAERVGAGIGHGCPCPRHSLHARTRLLTFTALHERRNFEYFGEDPFLAATVAAALSRHAAAGRQSHREAFPRN